MTITIVGIDCATAPERTAVALGSLQGSHVTLHAVRMGSKGRPVARTVTQWVGEHRQALLAIDAPLGWPQPLGDALHRHQAGEPLAGHANTLFRRGTDRVVRARIGKQPLDVGADRIARTAHAALALMAEVRALTGRRLALAWDPHDLSDTSAIEVYPAGTLRAAGLRSQGYKGAADRPMRHDLITALRAHMHFPRDTTALEDEADALDAAICVLAGADFLTGKAIPPDDLAVARREGWIWVREPERSPPRERRGS